MGTWRLTGRLRWKVEDFKDSYNHSYGERRILQQEWVWEGDSESSPGLDTPIHKRRWEFVPTLDWYEPNEYN